MTTIVPTASKKLEALLAKSSTKLSDIMDAVARSRADKHEEKQSHRPIPKVPAVKPEERAILRTVVDRVQAFAFPTEARLLTEAEKAEAILLFDDIKKAAKVLTKFEETFKLTAHNHLDVELGDAARKLDQDKNGHLVAKGVIAAEGISRVISRELRGGSAEPLTLLDLQALVEQGHLSEDDFKSMTVPVPRQIIPASRAVSEEGVLNRIKADPKIALALAKVARLTPETTAIAMRDAKPQV